MTKNILCASLVAAIALSALPALGATALPGGATNLTETHGDWAVRCGAANEVVSCEAFQEQISNDTKQRLLAISFGSGGDVVSGVLVLPFGLQLANGAVLQLDDKLTSPARPFQTCLPSGCLVPLELDAEWISAMRAGTSLGVSAQSVSGQDAKFAISLKGFSSALDRIADLVK